MTDRIAFGVTTAEQCGRGVHPQSSIWPEPLEVISFRPRAERESSGRAPWFDLGYTSQPRRS
jgi:hypothetical protein